MHGKYSLAPLIGEAHAQASPQAWWPSRWGKDDEAGASNLMTPDKVLDSARWIKDGKVYRIGRVYESGMPLFGARAFSLRIPGGPTGGPFGENKLVYNDDFLATEIGQVGTQFDGLGHIGVQLGKDGDKSEMRFYNGITSARDQPGLRSGQTGCRKGQTLLHPRAPGRCDGQPRRDVGRRPGDQARRCARSARQARDERGRHQARRRRLLQYRLGQPLDEEQRPLQQRRARHRTRGCALAGGETGRPHRRRHLGHRSGSQPRQAPGLSRCMPNC